MKPETEAIVRRLDKLRVAITNLVTSTAQNVTDTQTITGVTMVLANTPTFIYGVYMNGQYLYLTADYTIVAGTITFTTTMAADKISVIYKY